MLELLINKNKNIENIVLMENGKIIENYASTEEDKKRRIEGNIYVGTVIDIVKGMQAAFVDFGGERNGFIHLKDSIAQIDETKEKIDPSLDIKDVLKPNQKILIQIKKDSDITKGAKVSTHISLPGKYVVLMPNTNFITISQKIEDETKRQKLKKIIKDNLPKGFGAIVRTSGENSTKDTLIEDIKKLLNKWNMIESKYKNNKKTPSLIWESENIYEKIITDLGPKELEKIVTNNEEAFNKVNNMLQLEQSDIKTELEKDEDLISKYDLLSQIEKLENRKIWLSCGGFITIDKTEALTAIDVNTGKFTGKESIEKTVLRVNSEATVEIAKQIRLRDIGGIIIIDYIDMHIEENKKKIVKMIEQEVKKDSESTVFKVNKEATIEIAKQLRLRDVGGIIIIDYIDMKNNENKTKIETLLKKELKQDRAKTQVEGFTKLNLMELTRKHICSHLNS